MLSPDVKERSEYFVFEDKRYKYENEREVMSDLYGVRGSNGGDCGTWIHLRMYKYYYIAACHRSDV